jgi:hypothetical protein
MTASSGWRTHPIGAGQNPFVDSSFLSRGAQYRFPSRNFKFANHRIKKHLFVLQHRLELTMIRPADLPKQLAMVSFEDFQKHFPFRRS